MQKQKPVKIVIIIVGSSVATYRIKRELVKVDDMDLNYNNEEQKKYYLLDWYSDTYGTNLVALDDQTNITLNIGYSETNLFLSRLYVLLHLLSRTTYFNM